jgi:uncharacterized protein YidB (DUF937 family)
MQQAAERAVTGASGIRFKRKQEIHMGLLDDLTGKAAPSGGLSKPLMIALGALIVGKMLSGSGSSSATAGNSAPPLAPGADPSATEGGLLGGLGGLLDKLQTAGHGDTVNSWVGSGANKPIDPNQLGKALGPQAVNTAAQQAGVSEQELLSQLAAALPGVVDKLTANGTIPNLEQLASAFLQPKK